MSEQNEAGHTPITDAAIVSAEYIRREMNYYAHKFVLADWARKLERDRAELITALEEIMAELDGREPPQGAIYRDTGGMLLARAALAKAKGLP